MQFVFHLLPFVIGKFTFLKERISLYTRREEILKYTSRNTMQFQMHRMEVCFIYIISVCKDHCIYTFTLWAKNITAEGNEFKHLSFIGYILENINFCHVVFLLILFSFVLGLPNDLSVYWQQYPWIFGEDVCKLRALVSEM